MSFFDTQDLLTSSSAGGSVSHCLNGRRIKPQGASPGIQPRLPQRFDLSPSPGKPFRIQGRRDREDGEVSDSSTGSVGASPWLQPSRAAAAHPDLASPMPTRLIGKRDRSLEPWRSRDPDLSQLRTLSAAGMAAPRSPRLRHTPKSETKSRSREPVTVKSATRAANNGSQFLSLCWLAPFLFMVLAARALIFAVFRGLGLGHGIASAALTATFAGSSVAVLKMAQASLERSQMMETEKTNWRCPAAVTLRIGGPQWQLWTWGLSLDEAYGVVCILAQFSFYHLFENWGLNGPRAYRSAMIVGHSAAISAFTVAARSWFTTRLLVPGSGDAGAVVWLGMACSNATASLMALTTWWHVASGAEHDCTGEGSLQANLVHFVGGTAAHLPVFGLVVIHATNLWLAGAAQQPLLVFACAVVAGVSLTLGCCQSCGRAPSDPTAPAHLAPVVLVCFCAASARIVWQHVVRPLSL